MRSNTPRLGLFTESDDEYIDQFPDNWPILDTFAGVMKVAAGVTPSNQYDGMIVYEPTTGISWIARKSPIDGTFSKQYLTYPWQVQARKAAVQAVPTGASAVMYNLDTWDSNQSLNSTAADVTGGMIKMPIAGIYELTAEARWASDADVGGSFRFLSIGYTGNDGHVQAMDAQLTNGSVVTNLVNMTWKLPAGFLAGMYLWQASGATKNVSMYMTATLVTPT